jgi:hypothetical protein
VKDIRGSYLRSLEESERPREHWPGIDPEDGTEWLFETVEEDGKRMAIKQMTVHPSGAIDRYWWENLEDEARFLTDQPVNVADELDAISADEFTRLWTRSPVG